MLEAPQITRQRAPAQIGGLPGKYALDDALASLNEAITADSGPISHVIWHKG